MAQTLTQDDLDAIVAAINAGKPHVTMADGVAHGGTLFGSTATLALKQLYVYNPGNDVTLLVQNDGTGKGVVFQSASDAAFKATCNQNGTSVTFADSGTALALSAPPGSNAGMSIDSSGGPAVSLAATDATCLRVIASVVGQPAAAGITVLGAGAAPTVQIGDGSAGAEALKLMAGTGNTDADAVLAVAAGAGHDVNLAGSGDVVGKLAANALDNVLVDGKTLPAALQIIGALTAGIVSGAGTTTETFLGLDGVSARAAMTVDAAGNRTAASYP